MVADWEKTAAIRAEQAAIRAVLEARDLSTDELDALDRARARREALHIDDSHVEQAWSQDQARRQRHGH